jgi:hypothetical protein
MINKAKQIIISAGQSHESESMYVWMDGWMGGWVDGWMDG